LSSVSLTARSLEARETLAVSAEDSTPLVADLARGPSDDVLLIVPGFWRTRRDLVMQTIASNACATGLTVCTMDNRGHGDSGGTFGFNTSESGDVIRVVEALRERGLAREGVAILGFSAGGAIAISAAATRRDLVRGLVLVSPVADFKRVVPRPNPFRLSRQLSMRSAMRPPRFWWYETRRRSALEDASRVSAPTCIIHARNDWLVHHSHAEAIAARLPSWPEIHLLDLDRAHAERIFLRDIAPWDVLCGFLSRGPGMRLSGA
jgi:alpha-beta hydrolase superfamily lysophospholipase